MPAVALRSGRSGTDNPCMGDFNKNHAERGFTLIEMIAVVVILGVLSTVAVTAMADLRKDSWNARNASLAGAFSTALINAQSLCRVAGVPGPGGTYIDFPQLGGMLDLDTDCLPMGTAWSGGAPTAANCAEVMQVLLPTVRASAIAAPGVDYLVEVGFAQCVYRSLDASGQLLPVWSGGVYPLQISYFYSVYNSVLRGSVTRSDWDQNLTWVRYLPSP
jgi:prepilin-type N-terminal cleavage/methylation domain-containing protein